LLLPWMGVYNADIFYGINGTSPALHNGSLTDLARNESIIIFKRS